MHVVPQEAELEVEGGDGQSLKLDILGKDYLSFEFTRPDIDIAQEKRSRKVNCFKGR